MWAWAGFIGRVDTRLALITRGTEAEVGAGIGAVRWTFPSSGEVPIDGSDGCGRGVLATGTGCNVGCAGGTEGRATGRDATGVTTTGVADAVIGGR